LAGLNHLNFEQIEEFVSNVEWTHNRIIFHENLWDYVQRINFENAEVFKRAFMRVGYEEEMDLGKKYFASDSLGVIFQSYRSRPQKY